MGFRSGKWHLPDSPQSKDYRELLAMIEAERRRDVKKAMAWFAAVAESDFWFWQKYVMSLGQLTIGDPDHPRKGKLYVDEPWFFDRMREVQEDFVTRRSNVLYQWFRFSFKTTAVTKGGCLWFTAQDPQATTAIFTHKLEQSGESMGVDILSEVQNNRVLQAHWPQFRKLEEASDTRITVARQAGPREPSISLYPIQASATSGHFKYIFLDDAVTDTIIDSPPLIRKVERQLSRMIPLQHDDTLVYWVGTPWGEQDPIVKRAKEGRFSRVSHHPGILPGNRPQLRSLSFFLKWKRDMLDHDFASQILLKVVPRGDRYFRPEWLRTYRGEPETIAKGCRIHIVLDSAEGGESSDFDVVRVYAFTPDRKRRVLDLWRERLGVVGLLDLLLGIEPGDEVHPWKDWLPEGGLVRRWLKVDPNLKIWVEPYRTRDFVNVFRRDLKRREDWRGKSVSIDIFSPPKGIGVVRKKERRIEQLQPDYKAGVYEYPEAGFGHASFTTDDFRDTFVQFKEDEYTVWTRDGETENDDMLDNEAWLSQPWVTMAYPEAPAEEEDRGRFGRHESTASVSWASASWRVR